MLSEVAKKNGNHKDSIIYKLASVLDEYGICDDYLINRFSKSILGNKATYHIVLLLIKAIKERD